MAGTGGEGRGLFHRITGGVTERVVDLVDPDIVLDQVDVDALVARIDADALLARIDMNALLARVDLNALLDRVEMDPLLDRVDPDRLLARVDVAALVSRIDPDELMSRLDPNALLDRVDMNALLARVDMNSLLDHVDMNTLLDHVDLNALLAKVDVEALLAPVDLEALVRRSGVPELVAESTNQLAGSAIDLVRRQLVALDVVIDRIVSRLLRRDPDTQPVGPPLLLVTEPAPAAGPRLTVSGHYAGPVTRAAAAALDVAIITTSYTLGIAGLGFLAGVFLGTTFDDLNDNGPIAVGALAVWAFLYSFGSHAVAGRTLGKGIVGLRVVGRDGSPLSVRRAFVRTLAFPLSALVFGIGYLMVLVQREHRALHDLIAGTASVYDWGERSAEIPGPLSAFLARQSG
ncbi:RDD family protein [Nocardioides mangrovi]|uniref:RDD family protein n=1 Tax=Nocardioides mangrovi TaxID=2874580 RepID=A0ABS7UAL0_9ACTN|nr:RDD family protein [Nocardioides mangrovi]MBZ5737852.1 RDD family protein [Nocardioides mangrovi]